MKKYLLLNVLIIFCAFNIKAMQQVDPHPVRITIHNNHPEAILYVFSREIESKPLSPGEEVLTSLRQDKIAPMEERVIRMPDKQSGMSVLTPNGLYLVRKSYDKLSIYRTPLTKSDAKKREFMWPFQTIDLTKNAIDVYFMPDGSWQMSQ